MMGQSNARGTDSMDWVVVPMQEFPGYTGRSTDPKLTRNTGEKISTDPVFRAHKNGKNLQGGLLEPTWRGSFVPMGSFEPTIWGSFEPTWRGSFGPTWRGSFEPTWRGVFRASELGLAAGSAQMSPSDMGVTAGSIQTSPSELGLVASRWGWWLSVQFAAAIHSPKWSLLLISSPVISLSLLLDVLLLLLLKTCCFTSVQVGIFDFGLLT